MVGPQERGDISARADISGSDERGIEHAASSEAWLRETLAEIVAQLRRLFDLSGCAFQVVDWETRQIEPVAAWFASDEVRGTFGAVLRRAYEPERAGLTEAAIERRAPLLIARIEDWAGAAPLAERLRASLPPDAARIMWDWYRSSSFMACPVQAPDGRMLGVLTLASTAPRRPFDADDLRTAEVFAGLAGVALDRSELLAREEERTREELHFNRAAQEISRSLELDDVYAAIVNQASALTGLEKVILTRQEPATRDLHVVAHRGASERLATARFAVGEGMIGRVVETREPYVSREEDRNRFLPWVVTDEEVRSFIHLPLALGSRLFGVLTVAADDPRACDEAMLARLVPFGRVAAGAIANALDFQRERRIAHALTRGFVPGPLPELEGFDAGLVYEPAGGVAGGGDFFGLWRLPNRAVALLVGDVSGKGLEVAAISAMVRFFVEARTWDAADPAHVMAQTNALLRKRLPGTTFVPAVMAVIDAGTIRWCNAGHPPPIVLAADGTDRVLSRGGLPLGVDEQGVYVASQAPFRAGDLVFACTDGLTEARRDGHQFGDERLAAVLAEHGRALDPAELVRVVHREAQVWAPSLDDDVVVLALRRR
jgi:GAF domain-containing protein